MPIDLFAIIGYGMIWFICAVFNLRATDVESSEADEFCRRLLTIGLAPFVAAAILTIKFCRAFSWLALRVAKLPISVRVRIITT